MSKSRRLTSVVEPRQPPAPRPDLTAALDALVDAAVERCVGPRFDKVLALLERVAEAQERQSQPPTEARFLTVGQVADRAAVNPKTVRAWIEEGRLNAVKPGREYRIEEADFLAFMRGSGGGERKSVADIDGIAQRILLGRNR